MKRDWFTFRAQADPTKVEINVYGPIGAVGPDDDAVTSKAFLEQLQGLPAGVKDITVRVNSAGGDPTEGTAIANALKEQRQRHSRTVTTRIDALAASAATLITCAGSPILIADNAIMLVHEPWTITWGRARDLRTSADALDRIFEAMLKVYAWVSPKSEAELRAMCEAETWFDAREAVAAGFATAIVETNTGVTAQARLDQGGGRALSVPNRFKDRATLPAGTQFKADSRRTLSTADLYAGRNARVQQVTR